MKTECIFCGKLFSAGKEYFHLHNNCKLTDANKVYKFCSFVYGKDVIDTSIDKYINGCSMDELTSYGFSRKMFTELLNEKNIHIRNISESNKTLYRNAKYSNTCMRVYGTKNVSQHVDIKKKKCNTFTEHYGVDNVWKCTDFKEKFGVNETMISKYGALSIPNRYGNKTKWWSNFDIETRKKMCQKMQTASVDKWHSLTDIEKYEIIQKRIETLVKNYPDGIPVMSSKLEHRIIRIANENNIEYKHQKWINNTSYDFLFSSKSILEVQGDYWHANPLIYSTGDVINQCGNIIKVDDIWNKDTIKKENAELYGYNVYYIWECELNSMSDVDIYEFIQYIS